MTSLIWSHVEQWWPLALSAGVVIAGLLAYAVARRYGSLSVAALAAGLGALVGIAWERIRRNSGPPSFEDVVQGGNVDVLLPEELREKRYNDRNT